MEDRGGHEKQVPILVWGKPKVYVKFTNVEGESFFKGGKAITVQT